MWFCNKYLYFSCVDTCKNFNTISGKDIHDSEVNKQEINFSSINTSQPTQQTRLTNLAAQRNLWEDDLQQPTMQSSNKAASPLSKKPNMSSVRNLSNSNSNSIAFKFYYTNTYSVSDNADVQTGSSLKKSEMGSGSSMLLVLGNGNVNKLSDFSSKNKVVLSVQASMVSYLLR